MTTSEADRRQSKRDYWSDSFLDRMRETGDPLADDAIAAAIEDRGIEHVHQLMSLLVLNDQPPPDEMHPKVKAYLAATGNVDAIELPRLVQGEELFADLGPEILMLLSCYSLPAAFAAADGVQVLYRSGYLLHRPNRRLFETTQMVIDVMTPGGLGPQGKGVRTAQKVRLMHAAVRQLVLTDDETPWHADFGHPINQEDLAATLMIFSYLVLDGLSKMGFRLDSDTQKAYLDAWCAIGRIMGVREDLLPEDFEEAKILTEKIQARQIRYSPEGVKMTEALLQMLEEQLPRLFRGFPPSLMRLCLPSNVADFLEVPRHWFSLLIVKLDLWLAVRIVRHIRRDHHKRRVLRWFNLHLIQLMVDVDRGGNRAKFDVPGFLRRKWDFGEREEHLSFWARFRRWMGSLTRRS